jgi:hypothetical protein
VLRCGPRLDIKGLYPAEMIRIRRGVEWEAIWRQFASLGLPMILINRCRCALRRHFSARGYPPFEVLSVGRCAFFARATPLMDIICNIGFDHILTRVIRLHSPLNLIPTTPVTEPALRTELEMVTLRHAGWMT